MENSEIFKIVQNIRKECDKKSQDEQIKENREFFELYPAVFWMARDKKMNLETFKIMLDLKNQIDVGNFEKESVDKMLGQMFYEKYVNIKE
jgi:hypothetical protein